MGLINIGKSWAAYEQMDERLAVLEEDAITVQLSQKDIEWIKEALQANQKAHEEILKQIALAVR